MTGADLPPLARRRPLDLAGLGILLFAGLNLNGVFLLLLRIEALLSPIALLLVVVLWLRYARPAPIGGIYVLFAASVGSYLLVAALIGLAGSGLEWRFVTIYASTLLFVSGLYFWLVGRTDAELAVILRALKTILLATCVFVLLSPFLASYFSYVAAAERASGLFENPNEAAVAALYALVLVARHPARSRLLTLAQAALAIAALLLTFSKSGVLLLVALAALLVIERRSLPLLALAVLAFALAGWGLWYVFENDLLELTGEQRERLADVLDIFGGEITARSTTGRSLLWDVGLRRIAETLPWGSGLGTFHAMEGGHRGPTGGWLGVHNTYLMILGEAGLAPFLLFLVFVVGLVGACFRTGERALTVGFGIVLFGDMVSTHGSLGFRLSNVALAVMMAVAARAALRSRVATSPRAVFERQPAWSSR